MLINALIYKYINNPFMKTVPPATAYKINIPLTVLTNKTYSTVGPLNSIEKIDKNASSFLNPPRTR